MVVQPISDTESQTAMQQGVYATPPVNEFGDSSIEQEVGDWWNSIVLYVVASSAGLRPDDSFESAFEWSTTFDEMNMW